MTDEELRNLLKQMRSGDTDAFEKIYNEMPAPVYTVALRITNDRTLAEDAVQEIFIKLYTSPPDENITKLRAYIFKAARNKALDMLRANPTHVDIDECGDIPSPQGGSLQEIAEALSTLSESDRSIVTLHINGGLKFREIAEITEKPLGTVLWRYRKAVALLRKLLSE